MRFCELLPGSDTEVLKRPRHVLLPIYKSVPPDDAQPIMALLLAELSAAIEPHFRHDRVLSHAFSPEPHSTQITSGDGCKTGMHVALFLDGRLRLSRVSRIVRPDLPCDIQEVLPGSVEVPGHPTGSVTARGNTTQPAVDAPLVENLAQTICKIDFTSVGVELQGPGISGSDMVDYAPLY